MYRNGQRFTSSRSVTTGRRGILDYKGQEPEKARSAFKNNLPKFSVGGVSELVVTVKEGPESLADNDVQRKITGKALYRLRGEDVDGDTLIFGVLGPDGNELLRFERKSKTETEVYLKKELDREVRDSYTIVLTLTDGRLGEGQFIHQTLVIIVDDINDNEPVFKAYRTSHVIPEGAPPQLIDTLEATDRDQGPFGQVIYQLQSTDTETLSVFKLQQQGSQAQISLVGQVDYEKKFVYELRVLATDRALQGPRHTATAVVIVKVEDLEDQPPVFTQAPAVTRIPEDLPVGAPVLSVEAQDGDRGVDNRISYRIRAGNNLGLFTIDERTGIVTTSGHLDREATEYRNGAFILQIEASEVGSDIADSVARTEVTVVLTDVNDQTPTFRSSVYYAEIIENAQINAPITFLGNATPEVFDHDQGTNGTFRLILDDSEGTFEVFPAEATNEASFVIRVRRPQLIDFEQTKVIRFNLIAKETNSTPKSSTAEVTVYVRDANDNFPLFLEDSYSAYVREDAQVGTIIAQVKAEDSDSELFGTIGIRYTSIRGPMADKLRLDPISGEVTIGTDEHVFDRETVPHFLVTVEARDELGKGGRNTVQLEVFLEDVNDNPPLFNLPVYEARLRENDLSK
ncbi:cadherin-23-like [Tropilaelaps mercedesae]|uniref:Cadherin-23-like n=1 Tax=Tropilaelaps mercedesae TaxID=418985 RepID=A0A1V9XNE3_9ACAR|nr:cadherin-23-like [Tropilaelaps mercedesae]